MDNSLTQSAPDLLAENVALKAELKSQKQIIVDLEKNLQKIASLATKDHLTQLPNRLTFQERLAGELDRVRRGGQSLALIMIDLDFFKEVNDTYGHLQGDQVLKQLARTITDHQRVYDTAARYGGEEFAIIMPLGEEIDIKDLKEVLERYRLAAQKINRSGNKAQVDPLSISLGCVVLKRGSSVTANDLILQADQNLYHSKNNGRNRCTVSLFVQPS